jgi:hypothetical protein
MRTRHYVLLLPLGALVLMGATCQPPLVAPPPTQTITRPAPPPISRIDTFVRIPIAELTAQAEAVVPRTFHTEPYRMVLEGTAEDPVVTAGYHVERAPLTLTADGDTLILRTTLAYWAKARRHAGPLYVSGSCGVDEPRRHFDLAVVITARVDGAWNLVPSLRVRELSATDRCEMTFAELDVTARVRAALVEQLTAELPRLRDRIRSTVDLRRRATDAWGELMQPVELDDGTFLVLSPSAIAITQPTIEGHFLRVGLSLEARPEVIVGARPMVTATPLPDAGTEVHTPALDLHVPMRIGYDALERALADHFRLESGGVRYPATGRRYIRPTHITLYGYGSAIVVRVEFTGFAEGVLYLTGTPSLDPETQALRLADLDFTVESESLLVRLAAFLRADDFRDDLRTRLVLDVRPELDATRVRLSQALRQRFGGLELEGAVDTLRVVAVYIDPDDRTMHAIVSATGVVRAQYIGE